MDTVGSGERAAPPCSTDHDARPPEERRGQAGQLASHAGSPDDSTALVAEASARGRRLMFSDRHPFVGGPGHRAAYLEDGDGYEVGLVAEPAT